MVINKVDPLSVAKVFGILYGCMGLVFGAMVSMFAIVGGFAAVQRRGQDDRRDSNRGVLAQITRTTRGARALYSTRSFALPWHEFRTASRGGHHGGPPCCLVARCRCSLQPCF
jgi:hypothetical protein